MFNALNKGSAPEILITSLKSYVEFKDLSIILYADKDNLIGKGKNYQGKLLSGA